MCEAAQRGDSRVALQHQASDPTELGAQEPRAEALAASGAEQREGVRDRGSWLRESTGSTIASEALIICGGYRLADWPGKQCPNGRRYRCGGGDGGLS